jgi:hypothetical protein
VKSKMLVLIVVMLFAAPFICQAVALAAAVNEQPPNPKVIALDTRKAGKPDRWEYYETGVIQRVEVDRNGDGKVDQIMYYDENGKIKKVEKDSTYSGKIDQWIEY